MIYGLIPVGGKGTRLSLPYSKEMLPQKNYDYYNPVINHLVQKMLFAGATIIVFVHGAEYKEDVKNFFTDDTYIHVLQKNIGFAHVIKDFYHNIKVQDHDKIIFGLPDSVFDKNIFIKMIYQPGIVCGLFTTNKYSKVDRLNVEKNKFQVKTIKTEDNLDWFWGTIKLDGLNIKQMINDKMFDVHKEIGDILNNYNVEYAYGESYLDLGTWTNYNKYLSSNNNFSNIEIEKKYDAADVDVDDFNRWFKNENCTFNHITSTDHYFTVNNPNVEFLRYRESSDDDGAISDLTIKNFNKSQFNRFELVVPLSQSADSHDVLYMLNLLNSIFCFSVIKECFIYKYDEYTIVMYQFNIKQDKFKIIEIELNNVNFNLLSKLEEKLSCINGFDPLKIINESKFQLIKKYLNDSTH